MTQKGVPLGVGPAPAGPRPSVKKTLDKDLNKLTGLGIGVIFLALVWWFSALQTGDGAGGAFIILAGIVGGYMALNIGANDVANNVGPAVGARALTMMGALVIAAVFETLGAILAGGDVVATVSKGIIDPTRFESSEVFVTAMLAALFAAALWVNLATYVSAPVSTTHAIVGGVMGAGIATAGFDVVAWGTMAKIAASWVISPVLGGVIAALFLAFIKLAIVYQDDKIAAAKRWVPVLVALMAGVFSAYLAMKGLKRVWTPDPWRVMAIGIGVFAGAYALLKPFIARQAAGMENRNKSVRSLFTIPLICSVALLSFAHGSNDVANAVGPLSAIVGAVGSGDISAKVEIPLWVMLIGAAGISLGLVLFGPKLVRRVGQEITKMNPIRAYCVALSAAITVILASAFGLPVSSTHIAVGAVFGVGFFREYFTARRPRVSRYNTGKESGGKETKNDGNNNGEIIRRRKLVRRSHLITIVAAWVITVPATAVMAGGLFFAFSAL
ncbi:MAG: inorganic phosphate transporter [Proteobacteria bacterium]|nr:inorganic phosphate transporter [Pseudomonadota bacterium]